jgi:hypothetical protein
MNREGGSIRAYQAAEREFADLIEQVDTEDFLVYMPHQDDTGGIRRMAEIRAQEEGLTSWEN